jgi:hypothetical protein
MGRGSDGRGKNAAIVGSRHENGTKSDKTRSVGEIGPWVGAGRLDTNSECARLGTWVGAGRLDINSEGGDDRHKSAQQGLDEQEGLDKHGDEVKVRFGFVPFRLMGFLFSSLRFRRARRARRLRTRDQRNTCGSSSPAIDGTVLEPIDIPELRTTDEAVLCARCRVFEDDNDGIEKHVKQSDGKSEDGDTEDAWTEGCG